MKLNNRLLFVRVVVIIILELGDTDSELVPKPTTAGYPGLNLNGKMFTLSEESGISFYSTYYPKSTAPPNNGVSVCLRFMTDSIVESYPIFTLSPSSSPLKLDVSYITFYRLSLGEYKSQVLKPNIGLMSMADIWTRVCLTVDTMRNLTQVFSGSHMSIRKFLPAPYKWSGEPVIDFSGFEGQLADVQVWDYPLHYGVIHRYMGSGVWPKKGSVLSWYNVTYTLRGNVLLEDAYDWNKMN